MNKYKKALKDMEKISILLYGIEDYLHFNCKKLGKVIALFNEINIDAELIKLERKKPDENCHECGEVISHYKYIKNKGLCNDCVRGLKCENCGFQSNKENDWIVEEDDIFCKKCDSYSVSPIFIELGVRLI